MIDIHFQQVIPGGSGYTITTNAGDSKLVVDTSTSNVHTIYQFRATLVSETLYSNPAYLFLRGIFKIQRLSLLNFHFGSPTAQQEQTMQFLWPSASRWKILWSSGLKCMIILTAYITWLPLQSLQWAQLPRQSRQWEALRHCLVFTTVIEQIASNGNSTNLLVIKTLKSYRFYLSFFI